MIGFDEIFSGSHLVFNTRGDVIGELIFKFIVYDAPVAEIPDDIADMVSC
ncbi:hypothetical protein KK083_24280 [Fulvivirgaceae bacterium PWU4]|uniref:Uncharacterized protein n=1 Tax=Chryseosolibacter histidini TaxID=2782349 RepID=A0AAP2GRV3_9BACT|nr:hypothetical protein [Chryseosolibacter histidini]